ncbi:hypothetical protein PINS_up017191 [Pythium insidiosum]|nr:hypothetical protein PINS_up017191 [Pythium insidiosum]
MIPPEAQTIIDDFVREHRLQVVETLVVILRGMPGTGKSTFAAFASIYASSLGFDTRVLSEDDFFVGDHGCIINPQGLREAYEQCFRRFKIALEDQIDVIIVDNENTFRQHWEPYVNHMNKVCDERSMGYSTIRVVKVQFEHGDLEDAVAMGERSKHDGLTRFAMAERLHYFDMHTPSFQAHFFVTQQLPPSAALAALNDSP